MFCSTWVRAYNERCDYSKEIKLICVGNCMNSKREQRYEGVGKIISYFNKPRTEFFFVATEKIFGKNTIF